jgi:hypothetical protein
LKRITAILFVLLIASAPSGIEGQARTGPGSASWFDGQSMTLVARYAEGRPERLPIWRGRSSNPASTSCVALERM